MLASKSSFMTALLLAFACLVQLVAAVPLTVSEIRRDVVDPPVIAPNASTVWVVGETQTVIWDTSNLPGQTANNTGMVLLGFMNDTTSGEHLMINSPLASGFTLGAGSVDIVVPDVDARTDYIIALLGDSGNISDKFTIKSANGSVPSSAIPATASSSRVTASASSASSESAASSSASSVSDASSGPSSTVTALSTSGTLAAESSASETASASQTSTSSTTSAAQVQISFSHPLQLALSMICIIFLA